MQPTIDSESARDELFRRIGRNVTNFQYLEATLRSMIPILFNKGTLKELQANQDQVSRQHRKSTLGNLANAYHERVYGKDVVDDPLSDDVLPDPTFAFGFNIEVTPETAEQWKSALIKLIDERNRLIHEDLLNVDLNSQEQCEELCARLDDQYIRIRRQLDHLDSLRTGFGKMAAELGRRFESGEFLSLLRDERDDV